MNEYRAADTVVAGFVTLLASAEALWKVKDVIQKDDDAKDIMFAFFQGVSEFTKRWANNWKNSKLW